MAQIVVDLDTTIAHRIAELASAEGKTPENWLAELARVHVSHAWPPAMVALAGAWPDFPSAEELRESGARDVSREKL